MGRTVARGDNNAEAAATTGPRTEPARPPSLGDLVGDVAEDVSILVRQEIALAKAELRQQGRKAAKAGAAFGVAAVAGAMALTFLSLAAMFGLAAVMPVAWAAAIVAGVWILVAAVAAWWGGRTARTVRPVPEQTIESVKEDVRWLRNRTS
ncbi:MAG TPA: phage holin family protein [Cryptosporangiaceae bacterium]|nr:phage holin family protein [Cryptosporangiaceae bacterium]